MKEIIDGANRKWQISVKIGSLKQVKDATNIDLSTFPECVKELSDVFKFCQVLWQLIKNQADKAGVTEQDFYDSLDGECVDNAFTEFLGEMVNFSPPQKRNLLRKIVEKAVAHSNTIDQMMLAKVDEIDLMKITPKDLGNLSTS